MFDGIIQFTEKLIDQFSWRRLLFIVITIVLVISVLWIYETYTKHFIFNKIEQEIRLLNQVTDLSEKVKEQNNEKLTNILKAIIDELEIHINHHYPFFGFHRIILKLISAAIPWALMTLFFTLTKASKDAFWGIMLVAIPCIIIAICLPTFSHLWINYILYPIGHFVLIVIVIIIWQNRKKKKSAIH